MQQTALYPLSPSSHSPLQRHASGPRARTALTTEVRGRLTRRIFSQPTRKRPTIDPTASIIAALTGAGVTGLIILGSDTLHHFDWVLLPYAMASIFCAAAVAYRYTVWLQRPPTKRYWYQGWRLFWQGGVLRNSVMLCQQLFDNFATQRFIANRSRVRWLMHVCLSWGETLAFAITFPLVFGWLHFETPADDLHTYQVIFLGVKVQEFSVDSIAAFLSFNALNISAVLVLIGVGLAIQRRLTEPGTISLQQFGNDVLPILLLFLVAVTGLGLTVSARWLSGHGFTFIAITHAASVIAMLLYLPFGKFFHIFQRPAQLGVAFYKRAAQVDRPALCHVCQEPYASRMQIDDLKAVLGELDFQYQFDSSLHYQDVCPPCRRRLLAQNQGLTMPYSDDPFADTEEQSVPPRGGVGSVGADRTKEPTLLLRSTPPGRGEAPIGA